MINIPQPRIYYRGEKYCRGFLSKVCIDWSKGKVRGSLDVIESNNHPNIKKKNQVAVVWFIFGDPDIRMVP